MVHIINSIHSSIQQNINAITRMYPHLSQLKQLPVLYHNQHDSSVVPIISGGGSGHEPAHAGFVGDGMLSAAICGAVFTSPTPDQVLQAIKEADEGAGVFMVIKNYSGDIMNFEMAQDMAEMEGIEVASVVVDDDIAVEDSLYTQGRRGVAGTIFVHKILGNAARSGKSLSEIKALADELVPQIHTVGLALSGATVPEVGKPGFVLADDEIEFGIGIHGEPGYRKEKMQPSKDLAQELVAKLKDSFELKAGEKIGILINGMGATPLMEQYVFANDVAGILAAAGLEVVYKKLGNYMTSIDMAGISLTFIKLECEDWLEALNSPVATIAW